LKNLSQHFLGKEKNIQLYKLFNTKHMQKSQNKDVTNYRDSTGSFVRQENFKPSTNREEKKDFMRSFKIRLNLVDFQPCVPNGYG
jgi:hypothetical protein